ncbi:MAG: hypothetical protein ACNA8L_03500 [Luteolibacter sp.]
MADIPSSKSTSSARSPFAGCLIFIAAGLVMLFLIGFSTYVLFRQYAEIEKFTEPSPAPRSIVAIRDHETDIVALAESLEAFRQRLDGTPATELRLTPQEINLAIAAYEPLEELRGTFEVIAIHDDHLEIAISFTLNGKPRLTRDGESGWITSDSRHLNATIHARPALLQHELILQILEIHPTSGAEVPREFIELMSPYRITERYLEHPVIAPAMATLTRVGIEDGTLVFTREPGVNPVDFISDSEVNSGARRFFLFFGAGASLFLLFASIVIFLGLRNAKKRDHQA